MRTGRGEAQLPGLAPWAESCGPLGRDLVLRTQKAFVKSRDHFEFTKSNSGKKAAKPMTNRDVFQIVGKLVRDHLIDFSHLNIVGNIASMRTGEAPGRLFECIKVRIGTCDAREVALDITFITHYFEECPDPPGVFGTSWVLTGGQLSAETMISAVGPYFAGLNWLVFKTSKLETNLSKLFSSVCREVREKLDEMTSVLADDPFRTRAHAFCLSLKGSMPDYESILAAISGFGAPRPLHGIEYSAAKAARQMEYWLKGSQHWSGV